MVDAVIGTRAQRAHASPAIGAWLRRRWMPIACMALFLAAGMAFSFFWGPVVRHQSYWITPRDLWGTFRTAQFVGWGDIGDVYNSGAALVTFPAISVILAPVAIVVDHFSMVVGFPFSLAHPTAWYLLGPASMLIGSVVLVPLDGLARRLGLSPAARAATLVAEAVVLFPVVVLWGHPEDPLALAFALLALQAAFDGRWRATGWLIGLALVTQPLVVLVAPVVAAMLPMREWPKLALRGALPSLALLAIPLGQSWKQTTAAILQQPNYPTVDHPTPWLALAPILSRSHPAVIGNFSMVTAADGRQRFTATALHTVSGETVAAGPGRLIAVALCIGLGIYVYRRRPSPTQVVWLCAVALALRCVFESVMDPYYLWPPLALAFVLAARSRWRFGATSVLATAVTWYSYRHAGPWEWWLPVTLLLAAAVLLARPRNSVSHDQAPDLLAERPPLRVGAR